MNYNYKIWFSSWIKIVRFFQLTISVNVWETGVMGKFVPGTSNNLRPRNTVCLKISIDIRILADAVISDFAILRQWSCPSRRSKCISRDCTQRHYTNTLSLPPPDPPSVCILLHYLRSTPWNNTRRMKSRSQGFYLLAARVACARERWWIRAHESRRCSERGSERDWDKIISRLGLDLWPITCARTGNETKQINI